MKKSKFSILLPFILFISCNDTVMQIEKDIDSNGLFGMVKEIHYKKFKNDSLIEEIVVHYSNTGYITGSEEYENSSVEKKERIRRDNKNKIKSIITSHQDGTVQERIYLYGKNGLKRIIQEINGTEHTVWKYTNDNLGRKIQEAIILKGEYIKNVEYEYFGDSITKTVVFNEDGRKESVIVYKEIDNILEVIFEDYITDDITMKGRIEIHLDSLNSPLKEICFMNGRIRESFSYWYDFDDNKNWIVQFKYLNGEIVEMTEREIKYY